VRSGVALHGGDQRTAQVSRVAKAEQAEQAESALPRLHPLHPGGTTGPSQCAAGRRPRTFRFYVPCGIAVGIRILDELVAFVAEKL